MYFYLLLLIKDSVTFQLNIWEDCVPVKQLGSSDTLGSAVRQIKWLRRSILSQWPEQHQK